jgi:hypothetical protein
MSSRKQRKRRAKELRHEYELVLVDETGQERPIEPSELRAERREKESAKAKDGSKGKGTKASGGKSAAKRRPLREVQPPSWNRVWKRAAFFGVFMFLVLSFVGGSGRTFTSALLPTVLYTALFIPFLYLLDRAQYNQYLKRSSKQPEARAPSRLAKPAAEDDKGRVSGLRRALRR